MNRTTLILVTLLGTLGTGCRKKTPERQAPVGGPTADVAAAPAADAGTGPATGPATGPGPASEDAGPAETPPAGTGKPVLFLVQSRFVDELQPDGTTRPRPGPATLVILRETDEVWEAEEVADPESNVFHKALVFDPDGKGPAVLTIGAVGAYLKAWRRENGAWTAAVLWHPTFGGQTDRLRDLEIGDVTGDGKPELVIATHDQGVVGVLRDVGGRWEATGMDRREDTFVHEIEIGDIDGDGVAEFFATPSVPNSGSSERQPGGIDMYRWGGGGFEKASVMWSTEAHAKEILAADLDGDGTAALFAVLEARTEASGDCTQDPAMVPLRIVRYEREGEAFVEREAEELPDCMCRFLTWGDVDGDGKNEMVAATKNAGLWLLRRPERAAGTHELIDADSGGFEHATLVTDLDGDGTAEIYVAADRQGELRRYRWNAGSKTFDRETIYELGGSQITWNVTAGRLP